MSIILISVNNTQWDEKSEMTLEEAPFHILSQRRWIGTDWDPVPYVTERRETKKAVFIISIEIYLFTYLDFIKSFFVAKVGGSYCCHIQGTGEE